MWFAAASLKKGTYKIVVYFTGNSRYRSLNKTATIKVLGSQATQLAVPDETYFSSEPNKPYTAYLQTNNEVLEKETLTFKIDGKTYTLRMLPMWKCCQFPMLPIPNRHWVLELATGNLGNLGMISRVSGDFPRAIPCVP